MVFSVCGDKQNTYTPNINMRAHYARAFFFGLLYTGTHTHTLPKSDVFSNYNRGNFDKY